MKGAGLVLILAGVVLSAGAQLLLKAGTNAIGPFSFARASLLPAAVKLAADPFILAAVFCYAASMVVWILALSRVEVSVAYPMLSLGYAINAVAAWLLLGEAITPGRLAGIGVIIVGVCLVARS